MAIALGILFTVVVVIHPLIIHLFAAVQDALLDKYIAQHTFGDKGLQAIGLPPKFFLVVISLIVLWALTFNFVCCSTLLVLSAALFTGQMLALFGCGVLSILHFLLGAAIAHITWSDHLKPSVAC